MKSQNHLGLKKRTSKQIARAGKTLTVGMIALPFIPFKHKTKGGNK